jgi:hypothetical protein
MICKAQCQGPLEVAHEPPTAAERRAPTQPHGSGADSLALSPTPRQRRQDHGPGVILVSAVDQGYDP